MDQKDADSSRIRMTDVRGGAFAPATVPQRVGFIKDSSQVAGELLKDRVASATGPAPGVVFVTGASRSGTTMLARLIGSHSRMHALNELHFFGELWDARDPPQVLPDSRLTFIAATLLAREERGLWAGEISREEVERAAALVARLEPQVRTAPEVFAATVRAVAKAAGKEIPCEQTPRNVFYARQLLGIYPDARIIHIVRDPRAVLASQRNRWRMRKLGAHHIPAREVVRNWINYHPVTMTRLWNKATEAALALDGDARVLLVRFEDLAQYPEESTQRICEFLGVAFEPAMIAIPRWGSSNLEHTSAVKGISRRVVDEWRRTLPAAHALICERMSRHLMERIGYEPDRRHWKSLVGAVPSLFYYPFHALAVLALNPSRAWILIKALRGARA